MGMQFTPDSIKSIFQWYGGHPLLIRLCCSWFNTVLSKEQKKPIEITRKKYLKSIGTPVMMNWFSIAVMWFLNLKEFYEFEYYVWSCYGVGQLLDVREAGDKNIKHLVDYGIIGQV